MKFPRVLKFFTVLFFLLVTLVNAQTWWEKTDKEYKFDLNGNNILIILGEDFDYHEVFVIKEYWEKWGAKVVIAGSEEKLSGHLWNRTGKGWEIVDRKEIKSDILIPEINLKDYRCIFLPGGKSPENLLKTNL